MIARLTKYGLIQMLNMNRREFLKLPLIVLNQSNPGVERELDIEGRVISLERGQIFQSQILSRHEHDLWLIERVLTMENPLHSFKKTSKGTS